MLYDHQAFTFQQRGGVSRLFAELIREFSRDCSVTAELALAYSSNTHLRSGGVTLFKDLWPGVSSMWKTAALRFLNQRHSVRRLRQHDYDVFHPTYYDPYFLQAVGDRPFVITVYDLTAELFGCGMSALESFVIRKKRLAQLATRVIAISETTKNDVVRLFGVPGERIDVVPLATSLVSEPPEADSRAGAPGEYLFFIGNRRLYKNFDFFVQSAAPLLKSNPGLAVACAGGGSFTSGERRFLSELGVEKQVIHWGAVDDRTLVNMYRNAIAFVFPSRYEGFGIPTLEAFACGCPVVAARAGALPEVGGDAALYFNPTDSADLQSTLARVLDDGSLRNELRRRGFERLTRFSWAQAAKQTRQCYEKALAG